MTRIFMTSLWHSTVPHKNVQTCIHYTYVAPSWLKCRVFWKSTEFRVVIEPNILFSVAQLFYSVLSILGMYKFEDTKGITKNRKSKDLILQWTKKKGHTIIYKILHRKLKIEQYEPHWTPWENSGTQER